LDQDVVKAIQENIMISAQLEKDRRTSLWGYLESWSKIHEIPY